MPRPGMQRVVFLCSMVGMKAMQVPVRNVRARAGNHVVSNSTSLEASYSVDESGFDSSTSEPNTQTAELTVESDVVAELVAPSSFITASSVQMSSFATSRNQLLFSCFSPVHLWLQDEADWRVRELMVLELLAGRGVDLLAWAFQSWHFANLPRLMRIEASDDEDDVALMQAPSTIPVDASPISLPPSPALFVASEVNSSEFGYDDVAVLRDVTEVMMDAPKPYPDPGNLFCAVCDEECDGHIRCEFCGGALCDTCWHRDAAGAIRCVPCMNKGRGTDSAAPVQTSSSAPADVVYAETAEEAEDWLNELCLTGGASSSWEVNMVTDSEDSWTMTGGVSPTFQPFGRQPPHQQPTFPFSPPSTFVLPSPPCLSAPASVAGAPETAHCAVPTADQTGSKLKFPVTGARGIGQAKTRCLGRVLRKLPSGHA